MWLARLLILAMALLLIAALGWWAGRWVILLPAVVTVYAVAAVGIAAWRGSAATRAFRAAHPDKRLLLAYSASAPSREYIEREWIPRWGDQSIILDPSQPAGAAPTSTAAEQLFRSVAGPRGHTPLAIVVPATGRITAIRFRRAFRQLEAGSDAALRNAEARLAESLGESSPGERAVTPIP